MGCGRAWGVLVAAAVAEQAVRSWRELWASLAAVDKGSLLGDVYPLVQRAC